MPKNLKIEIAIICLFTTFHLNYAADPI